MKGNPMSEFNFNANLDLSGLIKALAQDPEMSKLFGRDSIVNDILDEFDYDRVKDYVLDDIDYDLIKDNVMEDIDVRQIKQDVLEELDVDVVADLVKSEMDYDQIIDEVKSNIDPFDLWLEMESYADDRTADVVGNLLNQYSPGNGCSTGNAFTNAVKESILFLMKDDIEFQNEMSASKQEITLETLLNIIDVVKKAMNEAAKDYVVITNGPSWSADQLDVFINQTLSNLRILLTNGNL
jgi:hypothetical protein